MELEIRSKDPVASEVESKPLKYRKFSTDSLLTTDSESCWESDTESSVCDENVVKDNIEQKRKLSLDSGVEGQVVTKKFNPVVVGHNQKKLKPILKTKPQVFKIYEGKNHRPKQKPGDGRKVVGFIFPEGVKIPELVPTAKRLPVHHRARRTLHVWTRKFRGDRDPSIPWRPTAHTLGKTNVVKFRPMIVDEKIEVKEPVIVKVTKYGDLKIKKLKVSEIESDKSVFVEEESPENSEPEDAENLDNSDTEEAETNMVFVVAAEDKQQELKKVQVDEKENEDATTDSQASEGQENQSSSSTENNQVKQEEEDDHYKYSRRKALRYQLRGIQLEENEDKTGTKPNKKGTNHGPRFSIGGHGPGRAHRHYPHASEHGDSPAPSGEMADKKKPPKGRSPFRLLKRQFSPDIISSKSTKEDVVNNNKVESLVLQKKNQVVAKTTKKIPTQFEYLVTIAKLIDNTPSTTRPGKIVSTRFRRIPSYELFPYLV